MQVAITLEGVERDVLAWDYFSVISGEATREGVVAAGPVPVSFPSLSAYSQVRALSRRAIDVVLHCVVLLESAACLQNSCECGVRLNQTSLCL